MNYVFVPSLQFIASVRVAVVLWSQPDIEEIVSKFDFLGLHDNYVHMEWMKVKKKVEAKVEKIPLPNLLQEKLLDAVSAVALSIFIYGRRNEQFDKFSVKELHWTPHGCVDKVKSVQEVVQNCRHCSSVRFPVACSICLEETFDKLENHGMWLSNKFGSNHKNLETYYENELFSYWLKRFDTSTGQPRFFPKREERELLQYLVAEGSEMGCRYFWQKIRNDVDNKILMKMALVMARFGDRDDDITIPSQCFSDIFFFLLGKMNDEQKRKVLLTEPVGSLSCFLDWPYQKFFMQTINQLWDYLTVDSCITVLENILRKLGEGYRHYDFSALFQKCVQEMPSSYLSSIIRRCAEDDLLMFELFPGKDKELVSFILAHATAKQWEEIFFSDATAFYCGELASRSKWDSLTCFIEMCVSSEPVLEKRDVYKRKVKSFFKRKMHGSKERRLLRRMYDIVDKV